jgi:DNA-binding XRE family transcriptional regulator
MYKWITEHQATVIDAFFQDKLTKEKLYDYLERHEIVGNEIFPYLDEKLSNKTSFVFYPVPRECFLHRIPFYFYKPSNGTYTFADSWFYFQNYLGDNFNDSDIKENLEKIWCCFENIYYKHGISLDVMLEYPINFHHHNLSYTTILIRWSHYLDLAKQFGLKNKLPQNFIVAYNDLLEQAGLSPIVFELREQYIGEYAYRLGNVLRLEGLIPCDTAGQPILRWIGVDIRNAKRIWAEVDKKYKGYLYIEINPDTAVFGLNCWGVNDDGSNAWYNLFIGPQLLEFDFTRLKEYRTKLKLTQQEVAYAIDAALRTYQKWENGNTKPDCLYLLRLMKVLDIRDVDELSKFTVEWPN